MVSNKHLGIGLMALAVLFFIVGYAYVRSAEGALLAGHETGPQGECNHPAGAVCPYAELNKLAVPKYVGLFFDVLVFAAGLFLYLKKTPEEKTKAKARKVAKDLGTEEAKAFNLITEAGGMMFQNELAEKMQVSKVRITRVLDKLETKGIIERRRRGMTNIVVVR